jgi:hypothetical protein
MVVIEGILIKNLQLIIFFPVIIKILLLNGILNVG